MPNPDIAFLSAAKTAQAIKNKQFSPSEALQAYLDRIDQLDSAFHGYITVCREEALAWALEAEQTLEKGRNLGPLFGVPLAVKDQFWTEGILTTNGSRIEGCPWSISTSETVLSTISHFLRSNVITIMAHCGHLQMDGLRIPPSDEDCAKEDVQLVTQDESLQRGVRRLGKSAAFSTIGATLVALDAGILSVPTTTTARVAWARLTNRIAERVASLGTGKVYRPRENSGAIQFCTTISTLNNSHANV